MPATEVLISRDRIAQRVRELAAEIDRDHPDGPVYLVGVLTGACFFLSDLAREMRRDARIDFVRVASYGEGTTSSGRVRMTKDLDLKIEGQQVIVVEDIVDTGITLAYLRRLLEERQPRSLRIAALLDKPDRRQVPVQVEYTGFQIPDRFVVGYGLDYAQDYRGLPDVCVLEE